MKTQALAEDSIERYGKLHMPGLGKFSLKRRDLFNKYAAVAAERALTLAERFDQSFRKRPVKYYSSSHRKMIKTQALVEDLIERYDKLYMLGLSKPSHKRWKHFSQCATAAILAERLDQSPCQGLVKEYYSSSHRKIMIHDMHMMHIENVLGQHHLGERLLNKETYVALVAEYVRKTRDYRQALHTRLKSQPVIQTALRTLYKATALALIKLEGETSADRLRSYLGKLGHPINGKLLSGLFKDKDFKQAHYKRSDWIGAHGRFINTWVAA